MTLDTSNPFALPSTLPYELPPFADIRDEHYAPAFYAGMEAQLAEIQAIIDTPGEVTFDNTVVAMERSGRTLYRVAVVFFNKSSSDTSDTIDAIEAEIAPKLAVHTDSIYLNPALFARIDGLYKNRESLNLADEDAWLLEKYHQDFIQAGAHLSEEQRARLSEINEELSGLQTQFGKKLLTDTNDLAVLVEDIAELEGLGENEIAAAAALAESRGLSGKWLIGAVNFTGNPVLSSLKNRALREKIMKASLQKANRDNDNNTKSTLLRMVELRAESAKLFGKASHAEYVISKQTAGHPDRVHEMLRKIAPAAVKNARAEAADLQAAAAAEALDGGAHQLSTSTPMERAVPAIMRAALSGLTALRSFFFSSTISRSCFLVTLPTLSRFGTLEPDSIFAAFLRRTEAGGDFRMNVKDLSW